MSQIPTSFQTRIDRQVALYEQGTTTEVRPCIPPADDIPFMNRRHWFTIPKIISVFVDMVGSTRLSAQQYAESIARVYPFFTGTAVDLFHEFDAPYIDVRGDGVFGLFNQDQIYHALAAAITFKTFVEVELVPRFKKDACIELGAHIGIDQGTVLVRRIGLKRRNDRTDRQNEVWVGKPVNMSAKLASRAQPGELLVSDRYFHRIKDELVRKSCCCPGWKRGNLWTKVDVTKDANFDFSTAYRSMMRWCHIHGEKDCHAIIALDASAQAHAG